MTGSDRETEGLRDRLIEAVLVHVPVDSWSAAALEAGTDDIGLDHQAARRAFPRGPIDMVVHFSAWADRRMETALAGQDLAALKVRERVCAAVRARIEACATHREAVRLAIGVLALPGHAGDALRCLYRSVDGMWYAVGDRSTDFNFYTKRALLAGVHLSTTLYWLADESADYEETWGFLGRRVDDVMTIQKARGRLDKLAGSGPSLLRLLRQAAKRRRRPAA